MKVTVELISPLSVVTGCTEPFTLELGDNATGMDLIRALSERITEPPLVHRAVLAGGLMLLVEHAHSTPETVLKDGASVSVVLRISGI